LPLPVARAHILDAELADAMLAMALRGMAARLALGVSGQGTDVPS
jgi:hypothetical protein